MTILQKVTQSSKLSLLHLVRTNKSNKSPTSSLTQQHYYCRSLHILFTSNNKATHTNTNNTNNTSSTSSRYVNIPPSNEELNDKNPTSPSFNEDDYFTARKKTIEKQQRQEEENYAKMQKIRDELDTRTGRLWEDPWALSDEDWASNKTLDDLPDWTEQLCSRTSKERVKIHPDGVPTLNQLATLQHEPSSQPHPALGNPHPYLKHRKQAIYNTIYDIVVLHAEPKVKEILAMEDWDEKQNAIDDLFEKIYTAVRYENKPEELKKSQKNTSAGLLKGMSGEEYKEYVGVVLGSQPNFPKLVQSALENYLKNVVKEEKLKAESASSKSSDEETTTTTTTPNEPIFMDILKAPNSTVDDVDVPKLLAPIKPHANDGPGRMLEEWELSAKRDTKRIMCRECITDIAKSMVETQGADSEKGSRIFVTGREGVGKTAALAAVVASARLSGHIVLYIPDGRRLTHLGFYLEPNAKSKADGNLLFDLPILTNEICSQFLECHEKDLDGMVVTSDTMKKYVTSDQLRKSKDLPKPNDDDVYSLTELLKVGSESVSVGAACYQAAIDTLMHQSDKPFTVVMDEFNCYFDHGQYFHAQYDEEVKKSIPLNKFTLFKHFIDAVGVEKQDDGTIVAKEATPMKRGSIVVGTTGSHAVKRIFTSNLEEAAVSSGCKIVTVPQYSPLEVEHILANFEIIGIGRLRFDRGATVLNNQEVCFLRMLSGGVGQRLLDSCVH